MRHNYLLFCDVKLDGAHAFLIYCSKLFVTSKNRKESMMPLGIDSKTKQRKTLSSSIDMHGATLNSDVCLMCPVETPALQNLLCKTPHPGGQKQRCHILM